MMSAIKQGMKAFRKPQKVGSKYFIATNPHEEGTQKHREWEWGFNTAYFSNLERVKKYEARAGS